MNSPIGIFDSGLGGLSVARQVLRLLPNESIVYFADNAHVPYGERPLDQINDFAHEITRFLIDKGAKAVVMACNMSSAIALESARERFPDTPILGVIEPGAKSAVDCGAGAPIGVLATTGTVKNGAYVRAIQRFDADRAVVQQACPKFVPLVESGDAESDAARSAARACVAPLVRAGCRTIVLGCTHYPFLRAAIESAAGRDVAIVDPAEETALHVQNILIQRHLASDGPRSQHVFYASGETAEFSALGSEFLGRRIDSVETAAWGVDLGLALNPV